MRVNPRTTKGNSEKTKFTSIPRRTAPRLRVEKMLRGLRVAAAAARPAPRLARSFVGQAPRPLSGLSRPCAPVSYSATRMHAALLHGAAPAAAQVSCRPAFAYTVSGKCNRRGQLWSPVGCAFLSSHALTLVSPSRSLQCWRRHTLDCSARSHAGACGTVSRAAGLCSWDRDGAARDEQNQGQLWRAAQEDARRPRRWLGAR